MGMKEDCEYMGRVLGEMMTVKEQFSKIQENPALYGIENGLTDRQRKVLETLLQNCGEAAIAGQEILDRAKAPKK